MWAVVNGAEIKRDRVDRLYRLAADNAATVPDEEVLGAKLTLLDELITKELLLERAKAQSIAPTEEELQKSVTERRGNLNDADFAKQLEQRQLTLDQIRDEVRRELTVQKLMEREVTSKVSVTDEEVAAFYAKNREQFNVKEVQYHLAQIVVSPTPTPQVRNRRNDDAKTPAEATRKLTMLAERLKAGDDFGTLAADFSEDPESAQRGGDLGFVGQSAIDRAPASLRKAVMQMKPGQLSTVNEAGAVTLLALVKRQEAGQHDLTDPAVKDAIRNGLRDRRHQLLQGAFLARVRTEANVVNELAKQVVEANGNLPAAR